MQFVSIVGLFALLGIAWLLSYHKREVRLRPVFWGIGLQFVFALIILREDYLSYVGMLILGGLLLVYLVQRDRWIAERGWLGMLGVLILGGGLVAAMSAWAVPVLGVAMVVLVLALMLNARLSLQQRLGTWGGALLVTMAIAWMIGNGYNGQVLFSGLSDAVAAFLALSDYGAAFMFGNLVNPSYIDGSAQGWPGFGFIFAFKVLPTIIFFGGFMAVLYHLGIVQRVVVGMSRFMRWTIGTSGAETLSCSANVFVGQTEAPLLIKPFLPGMTRSELLTVMVGGFATIAGGVLAGYIAMGVPAGHLIAASVMSAPAALVIGKIIFPETEQSQTAGDVQMPEIQTGGNLIEAATNGITDGLKLALNVGAMLIGFIALIAVIDVILSALDSLIDGYLLNGSYMSYAEQGMDSGMSPVAGEYAGYFPGSLQTLFGTLFRPVAFLMGVPWEDARAVGNLLGIKISLNEFVAYGTLGIYQAEGVIGDRALIIATYALCGFANFSSIGIQIGGISAVAESRKSDLAKIALRAMFGGALASFLTATIAGIMLAN
jgi:CNT family concentrative nucleoside transporter